MRTASGVAILESSGPRNDGTGGLRALPQFVRSQFVFGARLQARSNFAQCLSRGSFLLRASHGEQAKESTADHHFHWRPFLAQGCSVPAGSFSTDLSTPSIRPLFAHAVRA